MKQPHTETAVDHTDGEQDTGNHRAPGVSHPTPGGTRIGAENVEKPTGSGADKGAGLDDDLDESISVDGPTEREPDRDERGRM